MTFQKRIQDRIRELNTQYDKETWWKTDLYYRPINESHYVNDKYKKHVDIDESVETIDDLLKLTKKYPLDPTITYSIQMDKVHAIQEPLMQLNNMIGLHELKRNVLDQILYYVQDLHKIDVAHTHEYLHTVLSGSPGTGKTEVAKILGAIFVRLSILSRTEFKKATRDDLIAGYLGQTSLKTRELIEQTRGGVLFIDEAYSLGHSDKRDSYAKEAIDTLNEALSTYRDDWMVIIAGYENELRDCFFSYNSGLESRFPWWYRLEDYNGDELCQIFEKIAKDQGWTTHGIDKAWFERHREKYFKHNGRDMETLFAKSKIAYGRCMFGKRIEKPPVLTQTIVEKGFVMYCKNRRVPESVHLSMYM